MHLPIREYTIFLTYNEQLYPEWSLPYLSSFPVVDNPLSKMVAWMIIIVSEL